MYVTLLAIPAFYVMLIFMANIPFKLNIKLKLFNCELCMTFWTAAIYLLSTGHDPFTSIILAGASAYLTEPLKQFLS